ncbi:hypothetical protein ACJRO7_022150 [Eucalyptus globulus]|uniref:Uncharacterized protein n=1 Tax=Eucalyptus globulus TaxID=34317 RepID=A0ABD3KM86_EUCGL
MAKKVVIDLMTEDPTRKARARTIAVNEVTGLQSVDYAGENGNMLEVIAERVDATRVVDKIRREANLQGAKLISVNDQN